MIAFIIPADGTAPMIRDAITAEPGHIGAALRAKVGGPIERVQLTDERDMWINEEGKGEGLPLNVAATVLAFLSRSLCPGDVIVGDAVILGRGQDDPVSLTADQVEKTHRQLGGPLIHEIGKAL